MLSIDSGGYDVEDKIYLGDDYFEDDVDDENDK